MSGFCSFWPDSLFGVDYSMSCWSHDVSYEGTAADKIEGDLALVLDVWATAAVADEVWQRILIRINAVVMGLGVSTFGWGFWAWTKFDNYLDKLVDFVHS